MSGRHVGAALHGEATAPQPNLRAIQYVKAVSECVELRINDSAHCTVQRGEVGVRQGT
jgi:hypothetical protein